MALRKPVVLVDGILSELADTDQLEADLQVPLEQHIDEDGDFIYIGKAQPGTLESAAAWQIQRVEFTKQGQETDTEIRFADNDANFDNVWDDRTTLDYTP